MRGGAVFVTLSLAACGGKTSSDSAYSGGGRSDGGASGASGQSAGANSGTAGESAKLDSGSAGEPPSIDAGSAGEPPSIDAGSEEERLRACKHAFAIEHSTRCGGPVLPPDEAARAAVLFEQDCMNRICNARKRRDRGGAGRLRDCHRSGGVPDSGWTSTGMRAPRFTSGGRSVHRKDAVRER